MMYWIFLSAEGWAETARGLGYPEYIRDMRIKQVRSYLKKDRTTWVAETCVVSIHSYTSGSDDDGDSSPCSFPARRPTYQVETPISGSSDIPVVETTENEDSDTSSVSDPVMALLWGFFSKFPYPHRIQQTLLDIIANGKQTPFPGSLNHLRKPT